MTKTSIGLNISPPKGVCEDSKCPWHGSLPVRGRVFSGIVKTAKATNTVVVEWKYNLYYPKYERYARKKSTVSAHNPKCIRANEGDKVVIAECRPLSKTKGFVVVGFAQ